MNLELKDIADGKKINFSNYEYLKNKL